MRFLTYIESDESQPFGPPPPELFAAIGAFGAEMGALGVVVDQGGLAPTATATAIRVEGGQLTVIDGPFAEAKEVIGGYAMYDVRTKEEAIEYSRRFMQIHLDVWPGFVGQSVVRQVFGPDDFEGLIGVRFLMLIHEDPTIDVGPPPPALIAAVGAFQADRTHGHWVDDGGLAPPSEMLRLRTEAGAVTAVDGPFAEAKEVIGGFFIVESPSVDDMAIWAKAFTDMHAEHWPEVTCTVEIRRITDPG